MGTRSGGQSDHTGVSYQVGAVGWPDSGIPGRGLEIALSPRNAFSFLQTVLFDDVLLKVKNENTPWLGYISIRLVPRTQTLLGMQQFGDTEEADRDDTPPVTVMLEVVSYRSPQANTVIEDIQKKAMSWSPDGGPRPLLHWGLENDLVDKNYLMQTPLGEPYAGSYTRLGAFSAIRKYLAQSNPPMFDNNFTKRMGL
jgi:hypothetical protein